ncbi:hypothetical protein [Bacteroides pyogenes]|nr:hypothetical protein [Bacteroides pyogenes]MBR8707009.1 hypothetical protein [Bacteroides pyogenes]
MNIMKFIRSTYNYQMACMWQLQRLMHTISSILITTKRLVCGNSND